MANSQTGSGAGALDYTGDPTGSPPEMGQRCDFCGDRVGSVRRVALDQGYDRLQKAHQEQYACSECFELKEQRRLGLLRR